MPQPLYEPVKLTKSYIDKVKAPAAGYVIHWDALLKGYGLRVSREGRRVFIASGRVNRKQTSFVLGPYGELTEYEARDKARRVLQRMREGVDPHADRKQEEADKVTLATVATEYTSRPGKLKAGSKKAIDRHVRTTLTQWKDKPIASITDKDCLDRFRHIRDKGLHGRRKTGAPGQANQAFAILRTLINFANRRYRRANGAPLLPHNPVDGLKDEWVQLKPRATHIPPDKVGAVWSALNARRDEAYTRERLAVLDYVMLLILLGTRKEELASIRWDQLHLEDDASRCHLHLTDTKNGNEVFLPLPRQATDILKKRERVDGSPFVFATYSKAGYVKSPRDLMTKVSTIAGCHVTLHDLRRTYITIAVSQCGVDLYKAELLTNHVPKGVTARHYLETSRLQYLYPETQRVADWIEHLAGRTSGANVVSLRTASS